MLPAAYNMQSMRFSGTRVPRAMCCTAQMSCSELAVKVFQEHRLATSRAVWCHANTKYQSNALCRNGLECTAPAVVLYKSGSFRLRRSCGEPRIKLGSHSLMWLKAGQPQRSVHLLKILTLETSSHALIGTGMYYTSRSYHSDWLQTGTYVLPVMHRCFQCISRAHMWHDFLAAHVTVLRSIA